MGRQTPTIFSILLCSKISARTRRIGSEERVTEGIAPEGEAPEGGVPEGGGPEGCWPEGEAPEGGMLEGGMPEGNAPGGKRAQKHRTTCPEAGCKV